MFYLGAWKHLINKLFSVCRWWFWTLAKEHGIVQFFFFFCDDTWFHLILIAKTTGSCSPRNTITFSKVTQRIVKCTSTKISSPSKIVPHATHWMTWWMFCKNFLTMVSFWQAYGSSNHLTCYLWTIFSGVILKTLYIKIILTLWRN